MPHQKNSFHFNILAIHSFFEIVKLFNLKIVIFFIFSIHTLKILEDNKRMLNQLNQIFISLTHNIEDDLKSLECCKYLCDQYKIKISWVFLALMNIILAFTIIGWFEHILVTIFGLAYPTYMSFKVI